MEAKSLSSNFKVWCLVIWEKNTRTPKWIQRTKMLCGHRWADKTSPHYLLADWSQEEKMNTFTEKWLKKKRQHTWGQKYLCINYCVTMLHFCTSGQPFKTWVHKYALKKYMSMQMFVSSPVLHAFCISWTKVLLRADWFSTPALNLWGTSQGCTWGAGSYSHMCMRTLHTHTVTHSHMHQHILTTQSNTRVSPRPSTTQEKAKQKLKHNFTHTSLPQNEGIN